jgi:hypothetical protein
MISVLEVSISLVAISLVISLFISLVLNQYLIAIPILKWNVWSELWLLQPDLLNAEVVLKTLIYISLEMAVILEF